MSDVLELLRGKGAELFHTTSDAGGVLVGNETFRVLIPNGYGDGATLVGVLKDPTVVIEDSWGFRYWTSIQVEESVNIGIYDYDCSSGSLEDIDEYLAIGSYHIYVQPQVVIFKKR